MEFGTFAFGDGRQASTTLDDRPGDDGGDQRSQKAEQDHQPARSFKAGLRPQAGLRSHLSLQADHLVEFLDQPMLQRNALLLQ